ncbi:MAG: aspartate aminotransferase family protein [Pseudomonadota bacterium]
MSLMQNYARADVTFVDGDGVWLRDDKGRSYLDFGSGIAVSALGYNHPHLVATLRDAASKPWHVSNLFHIPEQQRLAERLCQLSFGEQAFFCNSGLEANEALIKLARRYHYVNGDPHRHRIITVSNAFYGRSILTLSAANNPAHLEGCGPKAPGFSHVSLNNMNEMRTAITDDTAAILLEPIQGEGGINPAHTSYLQDLRTLCDEWGILLLVDEIQCGNGRTGKIWAYEWADIIPDAMATAKGLGGGFPIGSVVATCEAARGFTPGSHGTTFGGNPLACAVANGVLDVIESPEFLRHVQERGAQLEAGLQALVSQFPTLYHLTRGKGLIFGLQTQEPPAPIIAKLRDRGLITIPASDNIIRIIPPLIITEDEVAQGLRILHETSLAS